MNQSITFGRLPNIEIEWTYYKELDEIYLDDMSAFGIILLTLVKGDNIQLVAYEIDTNKWGILQE
jgi:hypothetical protein